MVYRFEDNRIVGGIGADEEYWRGLADGVFKLPRCAGCGSWIWPAHFRCGKCGSWEMSWVETVPEGTVYAWTRSWYAFDRVKERAQDIPYVTVLAEVDGTGGPRVLGILEGPQERLKVGARVRGVIKPPDPKSKGYPSICWQLIR